MMPPAPYPNFRWLFRSLRALPIIAIAALFGGAIGGFSVFAIDLALTAPPSHDAGAEVGKIKAEKAPNTAATAPAAGTSAPPQPKQAVAETKPSSAPVAQSPAPQAQASDAPQLKAQSAPQIAVTPPLPTQQATWPDAMSRAHEPAPNAAEPPAVHAAAPAATAPVALQSAPPAEPRQATPRPAMAAAGKASATQTARNAASTSEQPDKTELARQLIPAAPRIGRRYGKYAASNGGEAWRQSGRPVYDSYARSDAAAPSNARPRYQYSDTSGVSEPPASPDLSVRNEYSNRRHDARRERVDDDRPGDGYVEDTERGSAMPPQPPPPPLFFGLFGGGYGRW